MSGYIGLPCLVEHDGALDTLRELFGCLSRGLGERGETILQ
jgi:hypothetical protein